ncbi:MAG: hypothetical protein DWQ04_02745 [Chloroflexi bacterium]|nr:MAG: hypothetical protein DWQ04_02745 [Chloroflexota bacterium]
MKQKVIKKCFFLLILLVTGTLCLLELPFDGVHASLYDPTPIPAVDILTKLQPYQISMDEPSSDGRSLEQALFLSNVELSPADTLEQQTFDVIADATILQGYSSHNFGDTSDMWTGYDEHLDPYGKVARGLVKFDIAALPANTTITKATLRVYLVGSWDYPDTERTITAHRVTGNWSESNLTWNNKPGYISSAYDSESIGEDDFGWHNFDITSLVSAWHNNTYTNHGFMLRGPEVSGFDASWRSFSTREGPYPPQLVVEYVPVGAPTPTPTNTPTPTSTPINTPTPTSTPTNTPTPTSTPTNIPTLTSTPVVTLEPVSEDILVYLPIILKIWDSGTVPPTAQPTAIPTATATSPPTSQTWVDVINHCNCTVFVDFDGPETRSITVSANSSRVLFLIPGTYYYEINSFGCGSGSGFVTIPDAVTYDFHIYCS